MDVARPYTAVSPSVHAAVLIVLAGSSEPRTGREIARRARRSKSGVQHALEQLVAQGIVHRLPAGNAQLYTLNREHLLAAAVQEMATAGVELIRRLRDAIGGWEVPAVHASLFGSAARGDGGIDSDIDLLIVRPRELDAESEPWRTQLQALAEQVHRWTGNHAGISEISETDLPRLRDEQPAILAELRSDAVDLAGTPTRTLLRDL